MRVRKIHFSQFKFPLFKEVFVFMCQIGYDIMALLVALYSKVVLESFQLYAAAFGSFGVN